MNYREVVDRVKADVEREALALKGPEADVQPRAYFWRGDGDDWLHEIALPFDWFGSEGAKEELVARFVTLIRAGQVRIFALQMTMYVSMVAVDDLTDDERRLIDESGAMPARLPSPSRDPDRREVIGVAVYDAERSEAWFAAIRRRRYGRPLLGAWEPQDVDSMSGRFADPIREAMR